MDTTAYIALSRQMALQNKMTATANNIANMSSTSFKAERMVFETVLEDGGVPRTLNFVQDRGLIRDLAEGPIVATGNPLDLALSGPGYLVVGTPQGPAYTRDGQLALNALGEIVTADGDPVLDDGGAAIAIPPGSGQVSIASDGTISNDAGIIGRLQIVSFADQQQLERAGGALYRTAQPPVADLETNVVQGSLEGSNVNSVLEMTTMMDTVRAFQSTQKMIETHHELVRRTVEQLLGANG